MLLTRKPNLGCVKVPSWDILGVFFSRSLHQASLLQPLMFHWCSSDVPLMDHSCSNDAPLTFHWPPKKKISSERSPSDDLRIGTCVAGRPEYSVPVPDHQQRLGDKSAMILGDFHMISSIKQESNAKNDKTWETHDKQLILEIKKASGLERFSWWKKHVEICKSWDHMFLWCAEFLLEK